MPSRTASPNPIEQAILATERLLGVRITIVDRDGVFHSPEGLSLLDYHRQSHRKNPACALGFSDEHCVGHCRHEVNALGEERGEPFVHQCWKGLEEVVVPLVHKGVHVGSLFAGIWRRRGTRVPLAAGELPAKASEIYAALPELEESRAEDLGRMLAVFTRGLLGLLDEAVVLDAPPESRKAEIRRYIRYNAPRRLALADLAGFLHLSPSRTSHVVASLFGRSFRDLLQNERIQRAKHLLRSTDHTVGQIARQVGMPDEYHFNRTFRACVGMPPGRFRKETGTQPYH